MRPTARPGRPDRRELILSLVPAGAGGKASPRAHRAGVGAGSHGPRQVTHLFPHPMASSSRQGDAQARPPVNLPLGLPRAHPSMPVAPDPSSEDWLSPSRWPRRPHLPSRGQLLGPQDTDIYSHPQSSTIAASGTHQPSTSPPSPPPTIWSPLLVSHPRCVPLHSSADHTATETSAAGHHSTSAAHSPLWRSPSLPRWSPGWPQANSTLHPLLAAVHTLPAHPHSSH